MLLPSPRYAKVRPGQRALVLPDRLQVCQRLARMREVGQRVDDGHRGDAAASASIRS